jgi:cardiolipin synthase (CMP-forming)
LRHLPSFPNLLTASRFVLAPWVAVCILRQELRLALWLLVAAGITDGLDGFLARRCGMVTRLGARLDPVADKVLLVTVYISLGLAGLIPQWLVLIVVGRDLMILAFAGAALATSRRMEFAPSVWGKLSTLVQIVTGVAVIGAKAFPSPGLSAWTGVLPVITAVTTGWSGLHYAWQGAWMWRRWRPPQSD